MTETANIHGTDGDNCTVVVPDIASQLTRLRNKVGALTPAGQRCSNLLEMFDELPPGPEDRIEYLTSDAVKQQYDMLLKSIQKQTAELAALTSGNQ